MKHLPGWIIAATLGCAGMCQGAFVGLTIQEEPNLTAAARAALADAGVVGAETAVVLRVYAAFDGLGDGATNTVLSTDNVDIAIFPLGKRFYQDPLGTTLPPSSAFFPLVPTLEFDTFCTIGGATIEETPFTQLVSGAMESAAFFQASCFSGNPPNHAGAANVDLGKGTFGTLLFQFTLLDVCGDSSNETGSPVLTDQFAMNMSVYFQGLGEGTVKSTALQFARFDIAEGPNEPQSVIDGRDLATMLSWWGEVDVCSSAADFNLDGVVDGADLAQLLSAWGPPDFLALRR